MGGWRSRWVFCDLPPTPRPIFFPCVRKGLHLIPKGSGISPRNSGTSSDFQSRVTCLTAGLLDLQCDRLTYIYRFSDLPTLPVYESKDELP